MILCMYAVEFCHFVMIQMFSIANLYETLPEKSILISKIILYGQKYYYADELVLCRKTENT